MWKIMGIRLWIVGCLLQIVGMMKDCPWRTVTKEDDTTNEKLIICNETITRASIQLLCGDNPKNEFKYTCKGNIHEAMKELHARVVHGKTDVIVTCKIQRKGRKKKESRNIAFSCEKGSASNDSFPCEETFLQTEENCVLEVSCSSQSVLWNCSTTTTTTSLAESTYSNTASVKTITTTTVTTTPKVTSTSSATTNTFTTTTTAISTNTPTSTSDNTDTFGTKPSSSTGTLAGGIIGGLFGGVCITVVVIVVWWKCCRKRPTDRILLEDKNRDSHLYLDLNPSEASGNSASAAVPDVIKTSGDQGDYTYISEEELDRGSDYSMGKAFPKTDSTSPKPNQVPLIQNKGEDHDTYNRLGSQLKGSDQKADAYNRIGEPHNTDGNRVKKEKETNFPSADYFVLESSPGNQDTYNKLRAKDESTGRQLDTYNRIGKPDKIDEIGTEKENDSNLTPADYSVLESSPENEGTYTRLGSKNELAD